VTSKMIANHRQRADGVVVQMFAMHFFIGTATPPVQKRQRNFSLFLPVFYDRPQIHIRKIVGARTAPPTALHPAAILPHA